MTRVDGNNHLVLSIVDSPATHGQSVACSGAALTADTGNDRAMTTGAGSTTPYTVTVGASATEAAVFYESSAVGRTLWNAGFWRLVTTVDSCHADITLDSIYICRVNAAGVSQGTVASRTGLGIAIPTGLVHIGLNQALDVTALVGDRVYVVLVLTNANVADQDLVLQPMGGLLTPMLHMRYVSDTPNATMTAVASAHFDGPSVVTTWDITAPTAEVTAYVDSQVLVRGGRVFAL